MPTKPFDKLRVKSSLRVPYGLAVHGKEEETRVLKVLREHRTIMGQEIREFEKNIAKEFGNTYGIMVNSGSSANLLAVELLNLPVGSEVITPILTFATTVAPLLMKRLVPVFVDVEEDTYVVSAEDVGKAITKKTKALMIPLLLGNVPNVQKLASLAKKHKLQVILDSCDTLGATYNKKKIGLYGDISTNSFYGSHIITAGGNGGMVLTSNEKLAQRGRILRGWGRGSASIGESENIEKRFATKIDNIPYDAKFIFSEIGYNFLPSELGAAFGNAQYAKLSSFQNARKKNFAYLLNFFTKYSKYFILPRQNKNSSTSWHVFPLTIKSGTPFTRLELVTYFEKNNIQTRPIFTGVITKQPGFKNIQYKSTSKNFPVTENIMKNGLLLGCHQGLEQKHLKKIEEVFTSFLSELQ